MTRIKIKQIDNNVASQGAVITFDGTNNIWSNSDNGAIQLSTGTTEQQPESPSAGMIRYNVSIQSPEYYNGNNWVNITGSSGEINQNAWSTFVLSGNHVGDSVIEADQKQDTLNLVAGNGIELIGSAGSDTVSIVNTSPNVDQNIWQTFSADAGSVSASTTTSILNVVGGTGISTTLSENTLTISSSIIPEIFQRAPVETATYLVADTDTFVGVQYTATGTCQITLPLGSNVPLGWKVSVKDEAGNAENNNITIKTQNPDTIDGQSQFIVGISRASIHLQWTGYEWSII